MIDMNYPNPCDTCEKKYCHYKVCAEYQKRYIYRQKQINAYARKARRRMPRYREAFLYEHPDIIRQYINNGPCVHCGAEKTCDTPCQLYWRWWDARREWLKGVWGM